MGEQNLEKKARPGRPPLGISYVTRSIRIRRELDDYITKTHEKTRLSKTDLINDAIRFWMEASERGELYGR
jgi:hypothetical protein